jgi:hypothetical protein
MTSPFSPEDSISRSEYTALRSGTNGNGNGVVVVEVSETVEIPETITEKSCDICGGLIPVERANRLATTKTCAEVCGRELHRQNQNARNKLRPAPKGAHEEGP